MRLSRQRIARAASGELIDTDDLLAGPVHDRNDGEGIGVEVGVFVALAGICSEDETLEVASILVGGIQSTIWPGFDDDFEALG